MKDIKEVINKGCFWLKNSGIINSSNDENLGGVRSWYDPDQDEYGFYYSEITGYMISTLLYIDQYIDKDSKNIQLACSSKITALSNLIFWRFGSIFLLLRPLRLAGAAYRSTFNNHGSS